MSTKLLDSAGRYDRAAIMRDAHRRFRDGRRLGLGWSFSQCLATAWAAARMQRASRIERPPAIEMRSSSSLARAA
jgi:hypothetical protein